jgi:hypothetical protein
MTQLPNDSVLVGCKRIGAFEWAQVFFSPSTGFTGTESEFVAAGYAYRYIQVAAFTRLVVA